MAKESSKQKPAKSTKKTAKPAGKMPVKKTPAKTPTKKTANGAEPSAKKKAAKPPVEKVAAKPPVKKSSPPASSHSKKVVAPAKKPSTSTTKTAVKKPEKTPVPPLVKKKAPKAVTTSTPPAALKKDTTSATKKTPAAAAVGDSAPATTEKVPRAMPPRKKTSRVKHVRRAAFTLEEVLEIAKTNEQKAEKTAKAAKEIDEAAAAKKAADLASVRQEHRVLGAASLADILGYNPKSGKTPQEDEEQKIPKKHLRFYRILVNLRNHLNSDIHLHSEDTLKRSSKEDSGDLSGYSQHIADAGTDTFDRDFALSLVSSEQEALQEIEEAIKRIKLGTYGNCELTGKPIAKERLLAVPFARYSVESQAQVEKTRRRSVQRGGIFGDAADADANGFIQEDADD